MSGTGSLIIYGATYLLATATPGPGIAAMVGRVLGYGKRGVPSFIVGFVAGDFIWFTAAATGMAALAQAAQGLFLTIKYFGAAYLLYLAYRLWTAPVRPLVVADESPETERSSAARLFATSLSVTLGNPKAMLFFLALLPTIIDLQHMTFALYLEIAVINATILTGVLAAYTVAALRTRRLFNSTRALTWMNRTSGTMMGGAAVAIATR